VSFAAITLCVASQRVFTFVSLYYFVIDSVRKLLDTPSYSPKWVHEILAALPNVSCIHHDISVFQYTCDVHTYIWQWTSSYEM